MQWRHTSSWVRQPLSTPGRNTLQQGLLPKRRRTPHPRTTQDQRGTGRSAPVTCNNLSSWGSPEEQAQYLKFFRCAGVGTGGKGLGCSLLGAGELHGHALAWWVLRCSISAAGTRNLWAPWQPGPRQWPHSLCWHPLLSPAAAADSLPACHCAATQGR